MQRRTMWPAVLAAMTLVLTAKPAAAQGWIEVSRGSGVVRLRTSVTARVTGRVARIEVEEWFQNRGGGLAEGDYQYPLPGEGSFADLSLWQGDKELKGETMDAARARAIYEEIVRRRRDPALVELVGHGLIRARLFPIAAGETRRMTLRYTQVLSRAGDALVFRYAASRPGFGTEVVPRPWPRPPIFPPGGPTFPVRRGGGASAGNPAPQVDGGVELRLVAENGAAFRDPYSPTHELRTERREGRLEVSPGGAVTGDLAIFLPLRDAGTASIALATYRTGSEDGYALITLSPGEVREAAVARDVAFAIDVSGSMSGEKIEQARRAAKNLLASLTPQDRFRLIAFNGDVDAYRTAWTPGTPAERSAASIWVDRLQAGGSTNIAGALQEAFRSLDPNRLPIVIFITDGLPTAGEQDPDRIAATAQQQRGRARVFAFGVGYDVNTQLLDGLTAAARGSTAYVEPGEDLERPLSVLTTRIRHPVLTDLRLDGPPVELRDIYPSPLPDLFAGDELVLLARYRGTGAGPLVFAGRRGEEPVRVSAEVTFPAETRADDYIPRLWASRRIGELTREIRIHGPNPELVAEIHNLALRYGILTEYTSYLVQEPMVMAQNDRGRIAPMPAPASGQAAVKSSMIASARRDATNAAAVSRAEEMAAAGYAGTASADRRLVAGHTFEKQGDLWVDALNGKGTRIVTVEPFSPAWFDVLRALPELRPWLSAMEQVEVAGMRARVRVATGGARTLDPAEVDRLVREFRHS